MKDSLSIIIPTYNRAQVIKPTLDSILRQTCNNWECIIVDDHSSDDTELVIKEYLDKDSRVRFLKNERKKGAQGARNTGLYNCNSEWVIFFDSDNIMHEDFVQELLNSVNDEVDVCNCYSDIVHVTEGVTGRRFEWNCKGNIHKQLFTRETYVDFNHAIIRRSKVLEIGGLDENCPSMQEWDTHIRLSNIATYCTCAKVLIDYFVGAKDAISSDKKREVEGRLYILNKHKKEWNKYFSSGISYCRQIIRYINKNRDIMYRIKAYNRLFYTTPALAFFAIIVTPWVYVRKNFK